jgi:hypothetical protein
MATLASGAGRGMERCLLRGLAGWSAIPVVVQLPRCWDIQSTIWSHHCVASPLALRPVPVACTQTSRMAWGLAHMPVPIIIPPPRMWPASIAVIAPAGPGSALCVTVDPLVAGGKGGGDLLCRRGWGVVVAADGEQRSPPRSATTATAAMRPPALGPAGCPVAVAVVSVIGGFPSVSRSTSRRRRYCRRRSSAGVSLGEDLFGCHRRRLTGYGGGPARRAHDAPDHSNPERDHQQRHDQSPARSIVPPHHVSTAPRGVPVTIVHRLPAWFLGRWSRVRRDLLGRGGVASSVVMSRRRHRCRSFEALMCRQGCDGERGERVGPPPPHQSVEYQAAEQRGDNHAHNSVSVAPARNSATRAGRQCELEEDVDRLGMMFSFRELQRVISVASSGLRPRTRSRPARRTLPDAGTELAGLATYLLLGLAHPEAEGPSSAPVVTERAVLSCVVAQSHRPAPRLPPTPPGRAAARGSESRSWPTTGCCSARHAATARRSRTGRGRPSGLALAASTHPCLRLPPRMRHARSARVPLAISAPLHVGRFGRSRRLAIGHTVALVAAT